MALFEVSRVFNILLVTGQYGLELTAAGEVLCFPEIGGSFTQSGGVAKWARVPSTPIIRNSRLVYIGVSPCMGQNHIDLVPSRVNNRRVLFTLGTVTSEFLQPYCTMFSYNYHTTDNIAYSNSPNISVLYYQASRINYYNTFAHMSKVL